MEPSSVMISAPDAEAACAEGAKTLGLQPDQVTVEFSGESTYVVTPKSAPGRLEIDVSEDGMTAQIKVITSSMGGGDPITVADVEAALAEQKVAFGIDKGAIEKVVAEVAATGEARESIVVASGKQCVPSQNASVEYKVGDAAANEDARARDSVRPGQILAVIIPATEGKTGRNVRAEKVFCEDGQDDELSAGDSVAVLADSVTFTAKAYGRVEHSGNKISVQSLVQISHDKMSARIQLFPRLSDNSALTLEDVLEALKDAGVVHGICNDFIVAALESCEPQEIEAAKAVPPRDGVDASIAFQFQLNGEDPRMAVAEREQDGFAEEAVVKELVTEGDVLAAKTPPQPAVTGFSVTGEELPGREPADKELVAGTSVELLEDELTYVVAQGAIGYANFIDGTLCVEDPVCVSDDALTVSLCAQPPAASGKALTAEGVAAVLEARGVTRGIDTAAIERAVEQAAQTGKPVCDTPIALGQDQQRGDDAQIELKFQPRAKSGTTIEGTDRLDYKERGTLQNVNTGDLLAVKIPATSGYEGFDVFGNAIPAVPGDDKELSIIENVAVSEDGLQYTAEIEGVVRLVGDDKIDVSQFYEVPGDVDYSTGNLTVDGTLGIKGWIRSGFTVRPRADLSVGAGIEDAIVDVGGNIEVDGGVVGNDANRIHAGGDIRAHFVENARLDAGGDIIVQDSIMHSVVSAEGQVIVTEGKGRIIGGSVFARKGIKANEIGSEAATRTAVSTGVDAQALAQIASLEKELSLYGRNKKKLALSLALLARKAREKTIKPAETGQLAKLVRFRRQAAIKEAKLAEYKQALFQTVESEKEQAAICVEKGVFEGTVVTVLGHCLPVREDIPKSGRFVLDMEESAVKYIG